MKSNVKKIVLQQAAKAAYFIGRSTAMSISRLGAFEPMEDDRANKMLREKMK